MRRFHARGGAFQFQRLAQHVEGVHDPAPRARGALVAEGAVDGHVAPVLDRERDVGVAVDRVDEHGHVALHLNLPAWALKRPMKP